MIELRSFCVSALACACLAASGCTLRSPLMKAPLVSATVDSVDLRAKHVELGPVSTRFCPGDPAIASSDPSHVGLLDEVILKAQREKDADYIRDADFSMEGNCVVLDGIAMK